MGTKTGLYNTFHEDKGGTYKDNEGFIPSWCDRVWWWEALPSAAAAGSWSFEDEKYESISVAVDGRGEFSDHHAVLKDATFTWGNRRRLSGAKRRLRRLVESELALSQS